MNICPTSGELSGPMTKNLSMRALRTRAGSSASWSLVVMMRTRPSLAPSPSIAFSRPLRVGPLFFSVAAASVPGVALPDDSVRRDAASFDTVSSVVSSALPTSCSVCTPLRRRAASKESMSSIMMKPSLWA